MIRTRLALRAAAVVLLSGLFLSGCTTATLPPKGTSTNAPSQDPRYTTSGPVTEIAPANRGKPIQFSGTLDNDEKVTPSTWRGKVVVLNFWYAGCAPCRAEAKTLESVNLQVQPSGVLFVGVNVRDQAATAKSFATEFGITYPSFLDADTGAVQLAFAGKIAPNAVPTTIVIDRSGRVASRVLGQLESASILQALISDAVKEPQ